MLNSSHLACRPEQAVVVGVCVKIKLLERCLKLCQVHICEP